MQQELLDHLKKITEEEQKILDGRAENPGWKSRGG